MSLRCYGWSSFSNWYPFFCYEWSLIRIVQVDICIITSQYEHYCGNVFVSEAGGLRLKSRVGQIKHSVATAATFLRKELFFGHNDAEMVPQNSLDASA